MLTLTGNDQHSLVHSADLALTRAHALTEAAHALGGPAANHLNRRAGVYSATAHQALQDARSRSGGDPLPPLPEDDRRPMLRVLAKAEALTEAACDIGGPDGVALHRRAGTYLRQAAKLHPLLSRADGDQR